MGSRRARSIREKSTHRATHSSTACGGPVCTTEAPSAPRLLERWWELPAGRSFYDRRSCNCHFSGSGLNCARHVPYQSHLLCDHSCRRCWQLLHSMGCTLLQRRNTLKLAHRALLVVSGRSLCGPCHICRRLPCWPSQHGSASRSCAALPGLLLRCPVRPGRQLLLLAWVRLLLVSVGMHPCQWLQTWLCMHIVCEHLHVYLVEDPRSDLAQAW